VEYRGSAWFLSTPKGDNYFKALWERGITDPDHWAAWHMPTATNPYIDATEIEDAKNLLPEVQFRQEFLADFETRQGTLVRAGMLRTGVPPQMLHIAMGVDLAISTREGADYTAVAVLGVDAAGATWVLDAQRVRAQFSDILALIRRLAAQWRPSVIAIETVQYQAAVVQELLRTTSLPVKGVKPDRDKQTRFLPLQARYEQRLVWHAEGLTPDFERELLAFPLGQHDDFVDAMGYAHGALQNPGRTMKLIR
jgi:predicted phage terminase large subunit-like protein